MSIIIGSTQAMLTVSSGIDLVLNALAVSFVMDLDEQLIVFLIPLDVRNAIVREFRDARDASYRRGARVMGSRRSAWGWWKATFFAMYAWGFGATLWCPKLLVDPVDDKGETKVDPVKGKDEKKESTS